MYKFTQKLSKNLINSVEKFLEENQLMHWSVEEDKETQQNTLNGFFETKEDASASVKLLKEAMSELSDFEISEISNDGWQNEYKKHLKPWSTLGLHFVPIWTKDTYSLPEGHCGVYLDAGMAFGTGSHETTRLCAEAIVMFKKLYEKNNDFFLKSFIDAGCGSGILAISAQKLGFVNVYGFDIDPEAVRISKENILVNDLSEGDIDFVTADLGNGLIGRQADLLVANILSNVLVEHIDILIHSIKDGGVLCLSGILKTEAEDVKLKFDEHIKTAWKANLAQIVYDGEWAAITYFRNEKY